MSNNVETVQLLVLFSIFSSKTAENMLQYIQTFRTSVRTPRGDVLF